MLKKCFANKASQQLQMENFHLVWTLWNSCTLFLTDLLLRGFLCLWIRMGYYVMLIGKRMSSSLRITTWIVVVYKKSLSHFFFVCSYSLSSELLKKAHILLHLLLLLIVLVYHTSHTCSFCAALICPQKISRFLKITVQQGDGLLSRSSRGQRHCVFVSPSHPCAQYLRSFNPRLDITFSLF